MRDKDLNNECPCCESDHFHILHGCSRCHLRNECSLAVVKGLRNRIISETIPVLEGVRDAFGVSDPYADVMKGVLSRRIESLQCEINRLDKILKTCVNDIAVHQQNLMIKKNKIKEDIVFFQRQIDLGSHRSKGRLEESEKNLIEIDTILSYLEN